MGEGVKKETHPLQTDREDMLALYGKKVQFGESATFYTLKVL